MGEQMTIAERFARLATILGAAQYNENGIATISQEMVGEILRTLTDAQAKIDALQLDLTVKDARIDVLTLDRRDTAKARDEARAKVEAKDKHIAKLEAVLAKHKEILHRAMEVTRAGDKVAVELIEKVAELSTAREERDTALRELGALKAEVEQLRPAADLGVAYMAYMDEEADVNDAADLQDALETSLFRACKSAEARS